MNATQLIIQHAKKQRNFTPPTITIRRYHPIPFPKDEESEEEDIYTDSEDFTSADEISPAEEGFMQGYLTT